VATRASKGPGKVGKALERLDLPSKLAAKRCHNRANKGLRKARNVKITLSLSILVYK